jgi:hypothetical protein
MDPATAALGGLGLALAIVVAIGVLVSVAHGWGHDGEHDARLSDVARLESEREAQRTRAVAAEALAESRRKALADATERASERARDAQADADRAARIDDAVDRRGPVADGDVDAALVRLLPGAAAGASADRGGRSGAAPGPADPVPPPRV